MGGNKHKGQAQRTKNCAKPASSGRIAELVDKGQQFPSYSGFNESRPFNASSSTVPVDLSNLNVDPNFTVVLKKMNKKDATTRFKALQELKDLCKGSSPDVMVEVLPVWCKVYTLLAIDVEHRVREAVQDVHRLIVTKVGRNLAPHLKTITPLWFLSQYDSYAPAASTASAAFQEAFPPHKVPEVISFCQAEILGYIQGNLLNLSPQDLSKGDLSKEEMELKYERIIICSLNGLALYLTKVPMEQIKKNEDILREILSSSKFWKFSKYKTPGVRSAWFSSLSSICKHAVYLIETEKKHVANSVIGGIDDYDSSVLSVAWESALRSFSTIEDFWTHINIDKFFLPKFANILRVGGQGNASFIFPNILLLLNSIPSTVIKDKQQFFGKIFSSFQEGMKQPLVYQSTAENEAVFSSFLECIQFVIMKNIEDLEFCLFVLNHLYRVIDSSMKEPSFRNQIKPLFRHLYQFSLFLQKNENSLNYSSLQNKLWEKITELSVANLIGSLVDKDQLQFCLNSQFSMLSVFYSPKVTKRKLKVSFADLSTGDTTNPPVEEPSEKSHNANKLTDRVTKLAGVCLETYYKVALDHEYKQYETVFISIIQKLVELFNHSLLEPIKNLQPLWSDSLLIWITSDHIPVRDVLGMVFGTLVFLESSQKDRIIQHLTKSRCEESLLEGLKLAAQNDNELLNYWLHSDEIREKICQKYNELDISKPSSFIIIKNCMLLNKTGDFVIGNRTVLLLTERVKEQLSSNDEMKIKTASEVLNCLLRNIGEESRGKHDVLVFDLMDPLFMNVVFGKGDVVYEVWEKAISILSSYKTGKSLVEKHLRSLACQLGSYITSTDTEFDVKSVHRSIIKILTCNDGALIQVPFIRLLLESVTSDAVQESRGRIEDLCLVAEVIGGNLPFDSHSDRIQSTITEIIDKWSPLTSVNTLGLVNSLTLSLRIIASSLGIDLNSDEVNENDDEEEEPNEVLVLPSLPAESSFEFCEYLVELNYGLVLLKKIRQYYYNTAEYYCIASYVEPLEKDLKELVQRCKSNEQGKIVNIINEKVISKGRFWGQVKEIVLNFLDGTVLECSAVEPYADGNLIPETLLSIPHIYKLKNMIKNKTLSAPAVTGSLQILISHYKAEFPNFKEPLNGVDQYYLILSSEMARLFREAVLSYPLDLSSTIWDFIRISAVGWLNRIAVTVDLQEYYVEFVTLTDAACSLYSSLSTLFDEGKTPPELNDFAVEWKEVFAADAFYFLCKAWERVVEERYSNLNHVGFLHFETLGSTLCRLCSLNTPPKWESRTALSDWVKLAVNGILIPFVPVQLTSYKLLILLLPAMMELDEGLDESSLDSVSCGFLEEKLSSAQVIVMAMLQEYSPGTSCCVAPFTDSYVYTLGYLLLWSALLEFTRSSQAQQKYLYPLWIKERNIVPPFIEAVLKLMPECVCRFLETGYKKGGEYFNSPPSLSFGDETSWTSERLSHLSCWLLTELLGHLPAVARQWAGEVESKTLALVDKIVTAFISPYLCSQEMEAIRGQQKSFDNMKVLTYPSVGEVVAIYTVEESSTELSIQLAPNYPLSLPRVDISKAMISSIQTRQWLKQLTIFLTHQNGSIWDGLIMWKNNLDKKFEGIEECYICFSVLHTTTHQLPKLSCHTCKKKFHSFCLFKWFSTSNKSTCPICRAIF